MRIAIAGDLHGAWDHTDQALLETLAPDALLVVGDLSDGQQRIPALLRQLTLPVACILGNHDTGKDSSGLTLQRQIAALGQLHCGWRLRELPGLSVVGGRPATAGGGYHLSQAALSAFGPVTLQDSVNRITTAAQGANPQWPLVLLGHSGPTGLGSDATSPCGKDWKPPACDWGDQDLALAVQQIQRQRPLPLVVFGHMHHVLRRGQGHRLTFCTDRAGTAYLNTASVPRHGTDEQGRALRHFSWVEFEGMHLVHVSHRWFGLGGECLYEEKLFSAPSPAPVPSPAPALAPHVATGVLGKC
ncbi:TIGR04168 family protein [Cyanobium sp. HWJ4-Hawea]|nr:TIGR04168 family protein [Cyanobium sp. HWJ4-Hawea]